MKSIVSLQLRKSLIAVGVLFAISPASFGAIIYQSAAVGPIGIPSQDVLNQSVPATSVTSSFFVGARFKISQPAITSEIGGHFVKGDGPGNTFFGAIVKLTDANDFPDSNELTTPDVVGTTLLEFPNPSDEVAGAFAKALAPGWYALVFGSGLFGTMGNGGALRNNLDIGDPIYIAHGPNLNWFSLDIFQPPFRGHRFFVSGQIVPEPTSKWLVLIGLAVLSWRKASRKRKGDGSQLSNLTPVPFSLPLFTPIGRPIA